MWKWFHQLGSPPYFYRWAGRVASWLGALALLCFVPGIYGALYGAPMDYQQGEGYRIIFVHVPTAWMSMFVYSSMAVAAVLVLVWRMKVAEAYLVAAAPLGAGFTVLALVTGSLWGKPMWGTYWVWDARLTSELILLFLYLGVIGLYNAQEDARVGARAAAVLTIVGVVNIPIIHFSVEWWHSLHQGPTITKLGAPSIDLRMLWPLLEMALALQFYFLFCVMQRMRGQLLLREAGNRWAAKVVGA